MQREERKVEKPWRKSMKSTESQEKEKEKHPETNLHFEKDSDNIPHILNRGQEIEKESAFNLPKTIEIDSNGGKAEFPEKVSKPWRQNMKRSCSSNEGN